MYGRVISKNRSFRTQLSTSGLYSYPQESLPCAVSCVSWLERKLGGDISTNTTSSGKSQNGLLSRLSTADYKRLEPYFEDVQLIFGETIYKAKDAIDYVYFPESGVLSVVTNSADKPIEIGLIGSEGLVGLPLFLGEVRSANDVIVQGEGSALRIPANHALAAFTQGDAFHDAVLLFAHELFLQVSQIASCNRHHEVAERLSRWLLMMRDRVGSDTLQLTQQFLSWMLGVRHLAVSQAAINLQGTGAIKYSRGVVVIVDRARLEDSACACYRMMNARNGGQFNQMALTSPA